MSRAILFSPGPFGGAERIVLTSTKELNSELILIKETRNPRPCEEFIDRCVESNIPFKTFNCKSQFDLSTLSELKEYIKSKNISMIHSHGMKANFYNSLLPVIKVATQHGKTSHSSKAIVLEMIEHFALKKIKNVICVSKAMHGQLTYKNKILIENYLSLETQKIKYSSGGSLNLVAIGRLSKEKAISDAIEAISRIENTYLTIVGEGPEKKKLQVMSHNRKTINFVGFQKDISKYLKEADALIMPSHREGLPMTLIEACAAGLPVIASQVGGIPDFLEDNSLLFTPNDLTDIKSKIIEFKNNRNKYNEKAKFFADIVKKKYSIQKWLEKVEMYYKSLE